MRPQLRKILCLPLLMAVSGLVHCGGKSTKSGQVEITLSPESPVVITSDIEIGNGGKSTELKGPWFKFRVKIDNQADEPVTIVALHVEATGMDASGMMTTVKKDFDPGFFNYTLMNGTCDYTDFGVFDRRGDTIGTGGYFNKMPLYISTVDSQCTGGGIGAAAAVFFYFDGAPKPPEGSMNYRYSLKIQPMGWFGTRLEPTDRFDGFATGSTQ